MQKKDFKKILTGKKNFQNARYSLEKNQLIIFPKVPSTLDKYEHLVKVCYSIKKY